MRKLFAVAAIVAVMVMGMALPASAAKPVVTCDVSFVVNADGGATFSASANGLGSRQVIALVVDTIDDQGEVAGVFSTSATVAGGQKSLVSPDYWTSGGSDTAAAGRSFTGTIRVNAPRTLELLCSSSETYVVPMPEPVV